jgi:hypothetical protein
MTEDIAHRLDRLDDKEAIYLVKILLHAAREGTPELAAMDEAAIASQLKTIAIEPEIFAQAAAFLEGAPTEPLPNAEAAVAARELFVIFAQAPGGERILSATLGTRDTGEDPGVLTVSSIFTFLWLAVAGDLKLKLGWFRYRKRGLIPEQQARLLRPVLSITVRGIIECVTAPDNDSPSNASNGGH